MNHEDEGDDVALMAFGLDYRGDADGMACEDGGDLGKDAGAINDVEAEVVSSDDVVNRFEAREGMRRGRIERRLRGRGSGNFNEVSSDGAGGGECTGTTAVEEGIAEGMATDGDGVEDAVDGG